MGYAEIIISLSTVKGIVNMNKNRLGKSKMRLFVLEF